MSRALKPLAQRMAESADWRLADSEHTSPHSVYRIFASDGTLLYIGCARDVEARIYMHRVTWTMADAFLIHRHYDSHTSQLYPTKALAREAERRAIRAERPMLNRQHNPRWRRANGEWIPADAETADALRALSRTNPDPALREAFASLLRSASP